MDIQSISADVMFLVMFVKKNGGAVARVFKLSPPRRGLPQFPARSRIGHIEDSTILQGETGLVAPRPLNDKGKKTSQVESTATTV